MSYSESVFFIPIKYDDFKSFTKSIIQCDDWNATPQENYTPRYFLNYALNIAKSDKKFKSFTFKHPELLDVYMYEDKYVFPELPIISDVRLSCFSTGTGFLEFWVKYSFTDPEEVANFAYTFKKAKPTSISPENKEKTLYNVAKSIIPIKSNYELFFTAAADFKCECQCYHFIHIDETPDEQKVNRQLFLLKRSYHTGFDISTKNDCDMYYQPYNNDFWAGSSEGLVNLTYDPNDSDERYLHEMKYSHHKIDYYFMYLLLLNQRFTCIQYITQISNALEGAPREIEILNQKIVELKTNFSFNIISDDHIFQNVYSRMYNILLIDSLLKDIVENEDQIEILRHSNSIKTEKLSNKLLFGISFLSIFSALIDASGFIDRISTKYNLSTVLGFSFTFLVVLLCAIWVFISQKRG